MNEEILKSQIRTWLTASAGMTFGWFASKGWLSEGSISAILNSPAFAAFCTMVGTSVWAWFTHTEKNAVAVVDKLAQDPTSPVKGVIVENSPAGAKLAAALPGITTVSAGSPAAMAIAQ